MRTMLTTLLALAFAGSVALAQGSGAPSERGKLTQQLRDNMISGAGNVQNDFTNNLGRNLEEQFGLKRSGEMMTSLKGQDLSANDSLKLLNGDLTKSQLQDLLGASRGEMEGVEKAVEDTVDDKDRKLFIGIIIVILVTDHDIDPSSEFCQQVCGARDEMSAENFEKLKKGSRSKSTLKDCFGFSDKGDLSLMQDAMNGAMSSPMMNHPMCKSLGMGDQAKFDPSQFPKLEEGMPGFGGFGDGTAGGLPFDSELPPCPFAGPDFDEALDKATGKTPDPEADEKTTTDDE